MPVGGILILFFDCFYLLAGLFGLFIAIRKSEIETFHYTVGGDSLVDGLIQVLNPILFPQSLGAGASQVVEQALGDWRDFALSSQSRALKYSFVA